MVPVVDRCPQSVPKEAKAGVGLVVDTHLIVYAIHSSLVMLASGGDVVMYTVHWPVQLFYTVYDWVHIQWQYCTGHLVLCGP